MGDRIVFKRLHDFYHHLSALHNTQDWTLFSELLQSLPDVAEELEGLKRVTKQQQQEPDVNAFIEDTIDFVFVLAFMCPSILAKVNYYMNQRFVPPPSCIVEEIRSFHRLSLYYFVRLIRDLLENEGAENPILKEIHSETDACLFRLFSIQGDTAVWKSELEKYTDAIEPLLSNLEQNHTDLHHVIQKFFEQKANSI